MIIASKRDTFHYNNIDYFEKEFLKTFFSPSSVWFVIYSKNTWELIKRLIVNSKRIVDLGCGGGTLLYNLSKITKAELIGVDFSIEALKLSSQKIPYAKFIQSDVCNIPLKSGSCDFVLSTMVIEHLRSDVKFINEINRILVKKGYLMISTVLKKNRSWYFYKNIYGKRVLEPTHVREYKDSRELLKKLIGRGFKIIAVETPPILFPLIDPLLKFSCRILKFYFWKKFLAGKLVEFLRLKTRIPIPGYYSLEVIAQKC